MTQTRLFSQSTLLCPEAIAQRLDFVGSGAIERTIADKQLAGVAGLWRLLCEVGYAYLADEVGMGKTYQALGVAALAWMIRPGARILVIAPNKIVQRNWIREYNSFIQDNVKACGGTVRDPLTQNSIHPIIAHDNLAQLAHDLLTRRPGLHLTRLSSFSHLSGSLGLEKVSEEAPQTFGQVAEQLHSKGFFVDVPSGRGAWKLTTSLQLNVACAMMLGPILPRFDLVIIDEAHLLRNRGANIMTNVFAHTLGMHPPASRDPVIAPPDTAHRQPPATLFLSATPAHRAESDIFNQLANVDICAPSVLHTPADRRRAFIAERFVRRLRLFCDQSKYTYRRDTMHEALAVRRAGQPEGQGPTMTEELFFIAAQRCVEQALTSNINASVKFGFLECLESYDPEELDASGDDEQGTHYESDGKRVAPDHAALQELVMAYQREVGIKPPHPKMGLVEDAYRIGVLEGTLPEKLLIFVRRRASVAEIARRICTLYDTHTLDWLGSALGTTFSSVADFEAFAGGVLGRGESEWNQGSEGEEDDAGESVRSRVLEVFASRRGAGIGAAHRFRDRFRPSGSLRGVLEENLLRRLHRTLDARRPFEAFLDEALPQNLRDTLIEELRRPYYWQSSLLNQGRAAPRLYRMVLAHLGRAAPSWSWFIKPLSELSRQEALPPPDSAGKRMTPEETQRALEHLIHHRSVWDVMAETWGQSTSPDARTIADELLKPRSSANLTEVREQERRRTFLRSIWDKVLRVGEGILELFCSFAVVSSDKATGERLDRSALSAVLAQFLLGAVSDVGRRHTLWRMAELARLGSHMERMLSSTLPRGRRLWTEREWNIFNQQEPILGVMGGSSSRERAIIQFNTPFFPDFVVCTDVLREGVNLHRSCRRVWHFGMSSTPGDIEQRTGRVDRYFSVVHRGLLDTEPTPRERARLEVGFPYLGQSIDEQQLIQALNQRLKVQPLLDQGVSAVSTSDLLDLDALPGTIAQLRAHLHSMSISENASAPFPPNPAPRQSHTPLRRLASTPIDGERVLERLTTLLEQCVPERDERRRCERLWRDLNSPHLALINLPMTVSGKMRDQPILVSIAASTGLGSHTLLLETPLGDKLDEDDARTLLEERWPETTVSLTRCKESGSIWRTRLTLPMPLWLEDFTSASMEGGGELLGVALRAHLDELAVVGDTLERTLIPEQDISWEEALT